MQQPQLTRPGNAIINRGLELTRPGDIIINTGLQCNSPTCDHGLRECDPFLDLSYNRGCLPFHRRVIEGLPDDSNCMLVVPTGCFPADCIVQGAEALLLKADGRIFAHLSLPPPASPMQLNRFPVRICCAMGDLILMTSTKLRVQCEILDDVTPAPSRPLATCQVCCDTPSEFAIERCGHLTRCIPCALKDRVCPACNKRQRRIRNVDSFSPVACAN